MASSVVYDANLGSSVVLKQVRSSQFSPNNTIVPDFFSGGLDPQVVYFHGGRPSVSFTSGDLAGVITNIDEQTGLHISTGTGTIKIPFNLRANGGTFAGTTSHFQLAADRGLFVPVSYSANQGDGDGAMCEVQGTFYSTDGQAAPVTAVSNATLSAQSYNASHRLGPVTVNGTSLPGVVGVTVNTGITVEPEETDGGLYPRACYITRRNPTITLRFRDMAILATVGPLFKTMTAAVVYFRKRSAGSSVVADATAEHCSFTFADGIADIQSIGASGNSPGEPSITLVGETLTASAAAAIS